MAEKQFTVIDEAGIHARSASALVNTANKFESEISLGYKDKYVNLKSILGVMSFGIGLDEIFSIRAEGADAEAALEEFEKMLQSEDLAN